MNNKIEQLKQRLTTASPAEAQKLKDMIRALEATPDPAVSPGAAPGACTICRNPTPHHFLNGEQSKLWGPFVDGNARAIPVEQVERKVE